TIKSQKELIKELRDHLKLKFEMKEKNTSELLANIIHNVVKEVKNNKYEDSQYDKRYVGYVDFDNENAEIEAFGEKYLSYFAIKTMDIHILNTVLFSLVAKLKCIAIHTCGSVCDSAGDEVEVQMLNKLGKKSYKPSKIIAFNPELRNTVDNKWYPSRILIGVLVNRYLDIEVAIKPTEKGQQIIWRSLLSDIYLAYDENQHWA
ncbi:17427_t:CDS:2, partial [Cetraspora pellucida]